MTPALPLLLEESANATRWIFPWPTTPLVVTPTAHCLAFNPANFDRRRFTDAGIDCPQHISAAVTKRQAEYFHGRLCARSALQAQGRSGIVATGSMREPIWPSGIVGSITHSRAIAAAVALPSNICRGVGIDIEDIAAPGVWDALRSSAISDVEYAVLDSLMPRLDLGRLLTLVFSAKESFFKATFPTIGRYFGFDAIALQEVDPVRRTLTFSVAVPLSSEWYRGRELRVDYALLLDSCVATLFVW